MSAEKAPRERLFRWLDARYELGPLVEFARHKEVPVGGHSMAWYYLGGTTLFFFLVQIVSGVLLLMYYQPGEATSYESIRYITTKVPFGWLVRSVHCWSAHLMILSLMVHMFSTMMLKAYRQPRELTWVTGFALFAVALGFGFSGYLLPWNELAFFATSVGTDSVKSVPGVGHWLLEVMRGGPDVTINTLYRFFALHVVVLPLAAFAVIGVHLIFVQRQGMAPAMAHQKPSRPGLPFFPDFLLRDLLLWLGCLILLSSLVFLLPYGPGIPGIDWELGKKANPLAPAYPGIKPEWYFLWVYQLLREVPAHVLGLEGPEVALLAVTVLIAVWLLVPWLDRRAKKGQSSPMFTDLALAALLFVGYLTLKAWDIGGNRGTGLPDPRATAWVCAWILLGAFVVVTLSRLALGKSRWFVLSGAATFQGVLNGLLGMDYLVSATLTLGLLVIAAVAVRLMSRRPPAAMAGGSPS